VISVELKSTVLKIGLTSLIGSGTNPVQ